jgi:hypothetical protein
MVPNEYPSSSAATFEYRACDAAGLAVDARAGVR